MPKERRRAIHCELIEASKTSPGYFKYQIKIREKDGSETIVPAYGKDMQDAIERLLWTERVEVVTNKNATIPIFVGVCLSVVCFSGALSVIQNNPIWLLAGMMTIITTVVVINRVDKYLKK